MKPLLTASEPAPFELLNSSGSSDVVLVCDHACNRIPLQLHSLGLAPEQLELHIAWDPGALEVARYLSHRLDAPLIFTNYSRLVIDCNRDPRRDDSIPRSSDCINIPGNTGLSEQDSLCRRQSLFDPYHKAIRQELRARAGHTSLLLSIHSFTPVMEGFKRPWPIGVCYVEDSSQARHWLTELRAQLSAPVGDNEPYSIEPEVDYTIPVLVQEFGIPAIMLEIRQDEIGNEAAAHAWGEYIANVWQKT